MEFPLAEGQDLVEVGAELWRRGIYVTLAAYPLVPRDQVGFRVQLTAIHTDEEIDRLCDALTALAADGVLRGAGTDRASGTDHGGGTDHGAGTDHGGDTNHGADTDPHRRMIQARRPAD
jgi:hypothetical protein